MGRSESDEESERDENVDEGDFDDGSDGHTFSSAGSDGENDAAVKETDDAPGPVVPKRKIAKAIEQLEWSTTRRFLYMLVESKYFSGFILSCIMLNTIVMTLQTVETIVRKYSYYTQIVDNIFFGCYVFEMLLKQIVYRRKYFQSGWNLFDMFIVMTSFLDYLTDAIRASASFNPKILRTFRLLRALRAIRALRVLRTIAFLKNLQVIVNTLLTSIPAMGSIVLLLMLILYIFAIIGRDFFAEVYPERFSGLGYTCFSLFQLITLDNWFDFYDTVRQRSDQQANVLIVYLVVFIILETFIFINLFTAVIVNNLQASQKIASHSDRRRENKMTMMKMNEQIRAKQESARKQLHKMLNRRQGDISIFYRGQHLTVHQKQMMSYYFMLMASLENNNAIYQQQQQRIDQLVDMSKSEKAAGALGGLI